MGGTNDGIMQRGSFKNLFFSNINTINPKAFPKHSGIGFILDINK